MYFHRNPPKNCLGNSIGIFKHSEHGFHGQAVAMNERFVV